MLVSNWSIGCEVRLEDVLTWSRRNRAVDRLLVVSRVVKQASKSGAGGSVLAVTKDLLRDHLLTTIKASAWPGSELFGDRALVFVARFDEECAMRMVATESLLSGWRHTHTPPLPEDICLFRAGDSLPAFYSVTHEQQAWYIGPTKPEFAPHAVPSTCERDELAIPEGEFFCDKVLRRL